MNKRTLSPLIAGALLALAGTAQAETFYFTFNGGLTAGPGSGIQQASNDLRNLAVNFPLTGGQMPAGSIFANRDAGNPFAFILGFDNGGSTALAQTWTAQQLKSMSFVLPTTTSLDAGGALGPSFIYTLYFGADNSGLLSTRYLNTVAGQLSTDASGQVSSVFSRLAFNPVRGLGAFTPSAAQFASNGPALWNIQFFGLGRGTDGGLSLAALPQGMSFDAGVDEYRNLPIAQYGGNAGLDDPGKWMQTTATGAPLVTAVPEPGTYALMLAGLGAVGFMARRRRSA